MSERQETVADIIAEMRRGTRLPGYWHSCDVNAILQYHADRLEAAHRRERGDSAKLREALVSLIRTVNDFVVRVDSYGMDSYYYECYNKHKDILLQELRKADSALAKPARNCDKYATADEALKAQEQMFNNSNFANGECKLGCPECDNPRVGCKIAWLYAPATEKEGGNNADE